MMILNDAGSYNEAASYLSSFIHAYGVSDCCLSSDKNINISASCVKSANMKAFTVKSEHRALKIQETKISLR